MLNAIDEAIKVLLGKISETVKSDDAVRFTQAAANLTHVKVQYQTTEDDTG